MSRETSDATAWRFALVTLVLPAAVTALGLIIQVVALRQPRSWLALLLTVALGLGLPAVIGLSSLPSLRRGRRSPSFRLFGAQGLGLSVLLTIVTTSVGLQSDGTPSSNGKSLWITLLVGLGAGVAAALVGWFLQPIGSRALPSRSVTPLELESSERAAWMRTASLPVPALAVLSGVVTIVAVKAGFGWATGDRNGLAAALTAVAVVLISLLATTAVFRVRVDLRGLSVRSALGVPRFRVAAHEVQSVTVVDARSLGVGGSWGIRVFPDRVTIVLRSTTGIRITRRDGRVFFVTVDDAVTGAALLEAVARQSEPSAVVQPSRDTPGSHSAME